jgi:hypothetical protein
MRAIPVSTHSAHSAAPHSCSFFTLWLCMAGNAIRVMSWDGGQRNKIPAPPTFEEFRNNACTALGLVASPTAVCWYCVTSPSGIVDRRKVDDATYSFAIAEVFACNLVVWIHSKVGAEAPITPELDDKHLGRSKSVSLCRYGFCQCRTSGFRGRKLHRPRVPCWCFFVVIQGWMDDLSSLRSGVSSRSSSVQRHFRSGVMAFWGSVCCVRGVVIAFLPLELFHAFYRGLFRIEAHRSLCGPCPCAVRLLF